MDWMVLVLLLLIALALLSAGTIRANELNPNRRGKTSYGGRGRAKGRAYSEAHLRPTPQFSPGPRVIRGSTYLTSGPRSHLPSYRIGREGEDMVTETICRFLDRDWIVFRNVALPDENGDIDMVLVGRGGIFALEVKTFTGDFRVEGGRWYKMTSHGTWSKKPYGPGAQARKNAIRLSEFLKQRGIQRRSYVEPIVVLSKNTSINVVSAGTEIWGISELGVRLAQIRNRNKLSRAEVVYIADAIETTTVPVHN